MQKLIQILKIHRQHYTVFFVIFIFSIIPSCTSRQNFEVVDNSKNKPRSVPISLKENLPSIEITIGEQKIPILLDLGGFDTLSLSPQVVDALNVTYTGKTKSWENALGKKFKSREYLIPQLSIGNLTFLNIIGYELRSSPDFTPPNKNGYIGLGILKEFELIIDYTNGKFTLINDHRYPEEYNIKSWPKTDFNLGKYGISTEIKTDIGKLKFVWDTGYSYSVIKPITANYTKITQQGKYKHFESSEFLLGDFNYGPIDFILFDFKQPPVDGMIGYNFFQNHVVYFNFKEGYMAVK